MKFKRFLCTMLGILALFSAASLSACTPSDPQIDPPINSDPNPSDDPTQSDPNPDPTNPDPTDPTPVFYSVSLSFDAEQGSISLDPASEDGSYRENTVVTVTVTANEGFLIDSFTVNGTEAFLSEEGTYSLTVTEETTLAATFLDTAPKPATLPESFYGKFMRDTGDNIIVVDETGFYIDEKPYPITSVATSGGTVYHTEWEGFDWIVTIHKELDLGVLRLTKVFDNGTTEIKFMEVNLDNVILENARGIWVDSKHGLTLEIGEKTVSINGVELTILSIGTTYAGAYADIYAMYQGTRINIFGTFTGLHFYIGNEVYDFVRQ